MAQRLKARAPMSNGQVSKAVLPPPFFNRTSGQSPLCAAVCSFVTEMIMLPSKATVKVKRRKGMCLAECLAHNSTEQISVNMIVASQQRLVLFNLQNGLHIGEFKFFRILVHIKEKSKRVGIVQ